MGQHFPEAAGSRRTGLESDNVIRAARGELLRGQLAVKAVSPPMREQCHGEAADTVHFHLSCLAFGAVLHGTALCCTVPYLTPLYGGKKESSVRAQELISAGISSAHLVPFLTVFETELAFIALFIAQAIKCLHHSKFMT